MTERSKRVQAMVDEMVTNEVDAIMDGTNSDIRAELSFILRGGRKGFDQMTDEEVEAEYQALRDEEDDG